MNDELQPWRVRIRGVRGVVGAGFLVDDYHIVTCAHIVARALGVPSDGPRPDAEVRVGFPFIDESLTIPARVISDGWLPVGQDQRGDIAVLRLDQEPPAGVTAAPLRRPTSLRSQTFRVYGYPRGLDHGVWAEGKVSGPSGPAGEWSQLEGVAVTGRRIEPGFSGAAVYSDGVGGVVGMVVANDRLPDAKVAWMIPLDRLTQAWPPLKDRIPSRLLLDPEFRRHWEPRSRGVERHIRPGWYFTGRSRALRELVKWLTAAPGNDRRARVVTGGPGSGKSAVLSRLVTLSDPQYRKDVAPDVLAEAAPGTVPPTSAIDVAVHASGKTVEEVVRTIADAAAVGSESADDLLDDLLNDVRRLTVVMDAVDEAAQPELLARQLLQPLALDGGSAGIRLLVGTRQELVGLLRAGSQLIDLDDPKYLDHADIVDYVRRYLVAQGVSQPQTPYRDKPTLADRVAGAVAAKAHPSFLVAQLVARSLVEEVEPVDIRKSDWQEQFPTTVGSAMDRYLSRFDGGREVTEILLPLAFSQGTGLYDEDLWATLASRLGTKAYTSHDIRRVVSGGVGNLIRRTEVPEGRAYRLFHEALAEHLQTKRSSREVHRVYVSILLDQLTRDPDSGVRRWDLADGYTRTYLPTHAARAGRIDEMLADSGFLLISDLERVLSAAASTSSEFGRLCADVLERVSHHLLDKREDERAAYLQLSARQYGAHELADDTQRYAPLLAWTVPWASWKPETPHRIAGRRVGVANVLTTMTLDDERIVALSGYQDGSIRMWDLQRGAQIGDEMFRHQSALASLASVDLSSGRPITVSAHRDGALQLWDPQRSLHLGDPLIAERARADEYEYTYAVTALATIVLEDGRPIAIVAHRNGAIRAWDLERREQVCEAFRGPSPTSFLSTASLPNGRTLLLGGDSVGDLRMWDLTSDLILSTPIYEHQQRPDRRDRKSRNRQVWAFETVRRSDGRIMLMQIEAPGRLSFCDLLQDNPLSNLASIEVPVTHYLTTAFTTGALGENRFVVGIYGGRDGKIRLWDLEQDAQVAEPLVGHKDAVTSLAFKVLKDGRSIIVSGGRDGTIRLWDLNRLALSSTSAKDREHEPSEGAAVLGITRGSDGSEVVISGGAYGASMRSLSDGAVISNTPTNRNISAMAVTDLEDNLPVIICGYKDGCIQAWNIRENTPIGKLLQGHRSAIWSSVTSLVILPGRPRTELVSAGADGTIRTWDLLSGHQIGKPLGGHGGGVITLAPAYAPDGSPIILSGGSDGTIRTWSLLSGTQLGTPFPAHRRPIIALSVTHDDGGRSLLISSSQDGTVIAWDLNRRLKLAEWTQDITSSMPVEMTCLATGRLSDKEGIVVVGNREGTITILDLKLSVRRVIELENSIWSIVCSPSRRILAAGTSGIIALQL